MNYSKSNPSLLRLGALVAFLAASVPVLAQPQSPKLVYGNLTNSLGVPPAPLDIHFIAFISTRPADQLTHGSPGCTVEAVGGITQYQVECASFTNRPAWQSGETLVIRMTDVSAGLSVTNQVVLNADGVQQFDMTFPRRPEIVTQPADQTVAEGGTATFNVVATGATPLAYQWMKTGVNISGATASSYTLNNVQAANAGAYSVRVSNVAGVTNSADATLTVLGPVRFLTQPVSVTVTQGQSATFSVSVSGSTPFSYQWKKAGVNLPGAINPTLVITNAQLADAGSYSVQVTNSVSATNSATATLTVLIPPYITTQPMSLTVTQGQTATFTVVANGTTPLNYQWQKNGTNITGATAASYVLNNVQPTAAGSYSVRVSNSVGATNSEAATLTVLGPPFIVTQPTSLTVTQGQDATFSVSATGTQPLGYQWKKAGVDIPGATTATLVVSNAQAADAVGYSVLVSNSVGATNSATATLTVLIPPYITTQPMSLTVTQGQTATFTVVANGTTPLNYQWQKNGTNITGATSTNYVIASVQTNHAGLYTVVVSNAAGAVTSAPPAELSIVGPPAVVVQPVSQTVTQGVQIVFSVTAIGTPPLAYEWRKDGVSLANGGRISGVDTARLILSSAQSGDEGGYSVWITNAIGATTSAVATLTVRVPPQIIQPPDSMTVTPGSFVQFSVVAGGTMPLSYQWFKDNVALANGGRVGGATTAMLVISNATYTDQGSYTVRISNPVGVTNSAPASLTVVDRALQVVDTTVTNTPTGVIAYVPVRLVSSGLEQAATFSLMYDTNLALLGVIKGSNAASASLEWTNPQPGQVSVAVSNAPASAFGAGELELAVFTLQVPPAVTNASLYLLAFGAGTQLFDTNGMNLVFEPLDGTLIVNVAQPVNTNYNRETGLFEGRLVVSAASINKSLRIFIHDLGMDSHIPPRPITVFNASGTSNGVPYLDLCEQLFASGAPVIVTVQYLALDRKTVPTPHFQMVEMPPCAPLNPVGTRIDPTHTALVNGVFYIEIPTLAGRTYYIKYAPTADTPDENWKTASPPFTGNGGHMLWQDNGPPKTDSPPASQTSRFYRAVLIP